MNSRIMRYNFKLVYTSIVYTVEINSEENLEKLFNLACDKFDEHINYDLFYIDYVIAGQEKCEMGPAVSSINLVHPLEEMFGDKYTDISFYVRPMRRTTSRFMRLDTYKLPELFEPEEPEPEEPNNENTNIIHHQD